MFDDILVSDLAISPSKIWAQRIEQASVIAPLAQSSKVGVSAVDDTASLLGLDRRQIYRLIKLRRARLKGAPPHGYSTGRPYRLDAQSEALIAQAIENAGSAARLRDVEACAKAISTERGLKCPNQFAIRTRFNKAHNEVDMTKRMQLDCDLLIDLCRLDLAVVDGDDTASVVWILGLFEPKTTHVRAHQIFAGKPDWSDLQDFLASCIYVSEIERPDLRIGFTGQHLFDANSIIYISGRPVEFSNPSNSRKVVTAEAFRAIFGKTVGRILIRSRGEDAANLGNPVDLGMARAIISQIMDNHRQRFSRNG